MPPVPDEPCVCSQLRRTARLVSLFYDQALESTGLSVTQYALLARIGRANGLSRTALAAQLGMDRTTLTRNLGPLERQGLIENQAGTDRREKLLTLTEEGIKRASQAKPHWQEAQHRMIKHLGKERWHHLRELLTISEEVLESI